MVWATKNILRKTPSIHTNQNLDFTSDKTDLSNEKIPLLVVQERCSVLFFYVSVCSTAIGNPCLHPHNRRAFNGLALSPLRKAEIRH